MPTFDGDNLVITLASGVTDISVAADLYSEWKSWVLEEDNSKYPLAFRAIGGDPLTPGIDAGSYYFIQNQNGWRIKPPEEDITVFLNGNLAPEDSSKTIFLPTTGGFTAAIIGLQPVTQNVEQILRTQQETSYNGFVHIDTLGDGQPGTSFPVGTASAPADNLADAMIIANQLNIRSLKLHGIITLIEPMDGWEIIGDGVPAQVNLNGQSVDRTHFSLLQITGSTSASVDVFWEQSNLISVSGVQGSFIRCGLVGTLSLVPATGMTQQSFLGECTSLTINSGHPVIDMQGHTEDLIIRSWLGSVEITNVDDAVHISIDLQSGRAILNSTVTNGSIVVRGIGVLEDNSTGATIDTTGLVNANTGGSAGPSTTDIADAVLSGLISDHQMVSGSLAEAVMLIKGLVQNNFVLDQTTYTSSGFLSSGRIRIFGTGSQVDNATDGGIDQEELATFEVSATADSAQPTQALIYKVKKL